MKTNNPAVIPGNHKVEQSLKSASSGDFKPFKDLLAALENPYKDRNYLITLSKSTSK